MAVGGWRLSVDGCPLTVVGCQAGGAERAMEILELQHELHHIIALEGGSEMQGSSAK